MKNRTFYSHGKLLLSGEYVVLDGALSLAVPTKYGQSLIIETIDEPILYWTSFDENKNAWFKEIFYLNENNYLKNTSDNEITNRLIQIFNAIKALNPSFLNGEQGYKIETHLEFPKNWGLGTSSTLISNIAKWSKVDAYALLENTFGGSGYDIACAQNNTPINYQIKYNESLDKNIRVVDVVNFNPSFKEHLYFVHLNKKQNSRDGIKHYHKNKKNAKAPIEAIEILTLKMIDCKSIEKFQDLIQQHETIISKITKQTPVKDLLFKDFNGAIKSLGAWGGDFVLVATKQNPYTYFKNLGYRTIITYSSMIL